MQAAWGEDASCARATDRETTMTLPDDPPKASDDAQLADVPEAVGQGSPIYAELIDELGDPARVPFDTK
jgi:hypothetical protein